jgi:O-antigen/teichoic acid export membrane protein
VKRTIENLVSVIGGETMVRVANFAAALVIARVHGAFVFGLYATSLATATVAVMFADNGLQTSAITELGNNRQAANNVIGQLYSAKTALILAMLVPLLGIGWWLGISHLAWVIGALVTLRTIIQSYSQLQMSILKSIGRMRVIGMIQGIHSAILLCGTGLALKQGWGILGLLGLLVAGQTLEAALIARELWRAGIWPTWPDARSCWTLILRSTPLGIGYGLANLIVRLDTIVLAALIPMSEMGQFSAADMILVIIYVVAWLSGSVLLPEMIRRAGTPGNLSTYANKWTRLVLATMTPCALLGYWLAPKVIPFLYGPSFSRAGTLASLMLLATPFIMLNSVYANRAIATGSRATYLGVFAVTAVATLVLNYFLGRSFGARGAAAAIVIREVGMFAGLWVLTSRASAPVPQFGVSPSPNIEGGV